MDSNQDFSCLPSSEKENRQSFCFNFGLGAGQNSTEVRRRDGSSIKHKIPSETQNEVLPKKTRPTSASILNRSIIGVNDNNIHRPREPPFHKLNCTVTTGEFNKSPIFIDCSQIFDQPMKSEATVKPSVSGHDSVSNKLPVYEVTKWMATSGGIDNDLKIGGQNATDLITEEFKNNDFIDLTLSNKDAEICLNTLHNENPLDHSTHIVASDFKNEAIIFDKLQSQFVEKPAYFSDLVEIFPNDEKNSLLKLCAGCQDLNVAIDKVLIFHETKNSHVAHEPMEVGLHPMNSAEVIISDLNYQKQLIALKEILIDADPTYLANVLTNELHCDQNKMDAFVIEALHGKNIPTIKEAQDKIKYEEQCALYTTNFTIEGFLKEFSDPLYYFTKVNDGSAYKNIAFQYLKNRYSKISVKCIMQVMNENKNNLTISCLKLGEYPSNLCGKRASCKINLTLSLAALKEKKVKLPPTTGQLMKQKSKSLSVLTKSLSFVNIQNKNTIGKPNRSQGVTNQSLDTKNKGAGSSKPLQKSPQMSPKPLSPDIPVVDVAMEFITETSKSITKIKPPDCFFQVRHVLRIIQVCFIEHYEEITNYLKRINDEKHNAFIMAKQCGDLLECNCCYNDEVIFEEIATCPEGHIFCKDCVRKGVETKMGEGVNKFTCLAECNYEFSLETLESVLSPQLFSKIMMQKQCEEIKAANIPDIEDCPFCEYLGIPVAESSVFICMNPLCGKESCRKCNAESHIPLRCEEIEQKDEIKLRTFIEDKMTEALIRKCYKCKKEFIKENGCNKIMCTCGAQQCYICRQPVKDYSHFNPVGGQKLNLCPLYSTDQALHVDAVIAAAKTVKDTLQSDIKLKHDPTKILPSLNCKSKHNI